MLSLEILRSGLTNEQRKLLTAIFTHFRIHKQWIITRALHAEYGGKPAIQSSLKSLGGAIVFERDEQSRTYYQLTFLGVLLTEDGQTYETLLVRYLGYVYRKCIEETDRIRVNSSEVATDLSLDPQQLYLLGFLINLGRFTNGSSIGADYWDAGIPSDVEDLPSNLLEYVHRRAMELYYPDVPLANPERGYYLWRKTNTVTTESVQQEVTFTTTQPNYVAESRIVELKAVQSQQYDLTKLIRLCEELNICSENGCNLAVAMLARALLDHIPPIFGASNFAGIANHYPGSSRSFKHSMEHLEKSCKNIADALLHVQIRGKESLPNETQVNFSNDLDVLLAEILRIL